MLTEQENDVFTRVGPGTPMGNLLRRYWHPVGCSSLVTSKPQRIRVLGEDLVLYRGASGKPVVMELRCAHRNVALDYGRVEGDSIRCPYHGWLYAHDGKCLAMPAEADDDQTHTKIALKSYVTEEVSGLIFAYMGPDPVPVLPLYDVLRMDGGSKQIRSYPIHANWFQAAENILDVSHFAWLHGFTFPWFGGKKIDHRIERTDYGMEISIGVAGQPMDTAPYYFPVHNRFAGPDGHGGMTHVLLLRVPVDDFSHENYLIAFRASDDPAAGGGDVPAVRLETAVGEYLPLAEDWWGIDVGDQDRMAMEQQGAIADRTREHLVASDVGIVRMRRMMREAIETVERGEDPIGVIRDPAKQNVENALKITPVVGADADVDYSVGLFSEGEKAPA